MARSRDSKGVGETRFKALKAGSDAPAEGPVHCLEEFWTEVNLDVVRELDYSFAPVSVIEMEENRTGASVPAEDVVQPI